jgi:hypothetical protein
MNQHDPRLIRIVHDWFDENNDRYTEDHGLREEAPGELLSRLDAARDEAGGPEEGSMSDSRPAPSGPKVATKELVIRLTVAIQRAANEGSLGYKSLAEAALKALGYEEKKEA